MALKSRAVGSNKPSKVSMDQNACKQLCDAAGVEYLPGYEGRVLQYTITDETVDRYGDIVKADGGLFDNYKKNAVIMTFHDYKQFPIGAAIRVWLDKAAKQVKAWVLIMDDRADPSGVSETAFRMASSGFMKAGSIGYMPKDVYRPTQKEKQDLGMSDYGVIYRTWELMEFSLCGVPANPNAVQNSLDDTIERGIIQEKDLSLLHKELDGSGDSFNGFFQMIEKSIKKEVPIVPIVPEQPAYIIQIMSKLEILEQAQKAFAEKGGPTVMVTPEVKAGAVLSKKNKDLIQACCDMMLACNKQMQECSTMLTDLLSSAGDSQNNAIDTTQEDPESGEKSIYEAEFETAVSDLLKSLK
jgi:hypothetical protein